MDGLSGVLWAANPRGKRRRRRALSAKQIAAGFGGKRYRRNPKGKRRSRRGARKARAGRRRSRGMSIMRSVRRRSRRSGGAMRMSVNNTVGLLKAGVIGGVGAVAVDVGMGYIKQYLPASMQMPQEANGQPNIGYFGVKALLAVGIGTFGGKVLPRGMAERMAEGALTVMAYQFLRPMAAQALPMGFFNPAPTMRPRTIGQVARVGRVGAYVSAYETPVRSGRDAGRGAAAASVLSMVANRRVAA